MNEIVEHGAQRGVAQVVVTVVHDDQRVATRAPEPRGQVDAQRALVVEGAARDAQFVDRAATREWLVLRPVRPFVAEGLADGVRTVRIRCGHRIQRIDDPFAVAAAAQFELVLDARLGRQLQMQYPQVAVRNALERLRGRQARDPAAQLYVVSAAPECERDAARVDQRQTAPCDERLPSCGIRCTGGQQSPQCLMHGADPRCASPRPRSAARVLRVATAGSCRCENAAYLHRSRGRRRGRA